MGLKVCYCPVGDLWQETLFGVLVVSVIVSGSDKTEIPAVEYHARRYSFIFYGGDISFEKGSISSLQKANLLIFMSK